MCFFGSERIKIMISRSRYISIYTTPPLWWDLYRQSKKFFPFLKLILRFILSLFHRKKIGGHYAVTRSLLHGLNKNKIKYNFNSNIIISKTVIVLSGTETLQFAITQKKKGKIQYLIAGPNISVLPSFDNKILASKEVDICLVPSTWVKEKYEEDSPELLGRIKIWAAGVDEIYWSPQNSNIIKYHALIYLKNTNAPIKEVKELLNQFKIPYIIIYYGKYSKEQYKESLSRSKFAIFLSQSESQGLALAEAWAMDVPTFSWNPGFFKYQNYFFENVSSSPYTTKQTGNLWNSIDELALLIKMYNKKNTYFPRKWILNNMTDALCSNNLLSIIYH